MMARQFRTQLMQNGVMSSREPQGADRERAVLFTQAKKKLSKASRHADSDALEDVRKTLARLQELLSPEDKDERDDTDEDVVDNEDDEDTDERMPKRRDPKPIPTPPSRR